MSVNRSASSPRGRLIEAMVEGVARDGYAATAVADVIRYAGASRSTFYEHFANKDDCFLAAAGEIGDRLQTAVAQRAGSGQGVALGVAEAMLEFAGESNAQARVLFTELLAGGSPALDLRDSMVDRLAAVVERGWSEGAGETPTLDLPASTLIGGVFRLLSFRMRRGASALHELQPAVSAWMQAYSLGSGSPQWQSTATLDALQAGVGAEVEPILPPRPLPRGRQGLAASEVARNHRDRLLHATAASVYEEGYAAVAVADIVRRAEVSRSVFYEHFRDKQAAALEAMQFAFELTMTACAGAFFAESGWPTQLWAGARALSDSYAAAPALVYLGFVESYAAGPAAIQLLEERMMAFTLLLEQGYHYRPEAKALPRSISAIIAFSTFELAYREVRHRAPRQFSHLLAQLAYVNLAPFMGAAEATTFVHERISEMASGAR